MSILRQICIVGGGPVGLTLANCLARSPYVQSITLIDRKFPNGGPSIQQTPNQRVYSINKSNLEMLEKLDIKKSIRNYGLMQNIHVVSRESEQSISWSGNNAEIIQNNQLNRCLINYLKENYSNKVEFIESEIDSFKDIDKKCQIKLKDGEIIQTKLLVGSDGNKSKVKQLAKITTYGWSYRQKAIVCTLQLQEQEYINNSAYQIYYEGNTLAVLPLWNKYVSIVWSLQLPQYQHLNSLNQQNFIKILNNILRNGNKFCSQAKFPKIARLMNQRLGFPLHTLQADRYTGNRLALIGDAAHSIHPMAGMGVNSGLYDAVFLANNIIRNIKTGNDIGTEISLSNFQVNCKKLNYSNSVAMQGIKKCFEVNNLGFNKLRKIGMRTMGISVFKDELRKMAQTHPLSAGQSYQWQSL